MTLYNEWCKIKRECPFSQQEWIDFGIASLLIGFLVSFNAWGGATFDLATGVRNFILATIVAALVLGIHHVAQRLWALRLDARADQKIWYAGSVASLLIIVITRGAVPFIAVTRTEINDLKYQRLGHYRYKLGTVGKMTAMLAGPAANLIIGLVVWAFANPIHSQGLEWFVSMNLLLGVFSLLPIPPLEGGFLFYVSRWFFAAMFVGALAAGAGYLAGITGLMLIFVIIIGMLVGALAWHYWCDRL